MLHHIVRTELWESFGKYYPIVKPSREASGLVLIIGGGQYLYINGRRHHQVAGDICYFRRGDTYRIELENSYIKSYVINFECDDRTPTFMLRNCGDLVNQFSKINTLWTRMREDEYYQLDCMGLLYRLLAEVFRRRDVSGTPFRKKERLAPAIDYIHEHYIEQEMKINSLADLCGLSERSFPRLFHEVYGKPPKRYLSALRVKYAKELLGGSHSISEVAAMCGFHDVYHFSGFFKGECGMSPSEYIRSTSNESLL